MLVAEGDFNDNNFSLVGDSLIELTDRLVEEEKVSFYVAFDTICTKKIKKGNQI